MVYMLSIIVFIQMRWGLLGYHGQAVKISQALPFLPAYPGLPKGYYEWSGSYKSSP
jgi:hypothetical protein